MSTTATTLTGTWSADPAHSRVGFSVKHLGIATVHGHFREFEGTLTVGEDPADVVVEGRAAVASVNTGQEDRDAHLRSAEFFDAEAHPYITFRSTRVEAKGDDTYVIAGDMTIAGATNELVLTAELGGTETDPWGNTRVGLEITGALSRGDYGMTFNQALGSGNVLVGDKVKLHLDVSAVQQA